MCAFMIKVLLLILYKCVNSFHQPFSVAKADGFKALPPLPCPAYAQASLNTHTFNIYVNNFKLLIWIVIN